MSLRDVNQNIIDGMLGSSSTKGEGVHIKIGVSPVVSSVPLIITGSMGAKDIKEKLGLSPLADACMDSVENGSNLIYCIPVQASIPGTVSEVIKSGNGLGTCTAAGTPNNAYEISVLITAAGGLNQAALKYSIDGEYSYSEEVTMPLTGILTIPNTGITLTFTEDVGTPIDSYKVGDKFKLTSDSPSMTNQEVLDALDQLRYISYEFEFVHIVGESTKALWAAVSTELAKFTTDYKKPTMIIMESRNINSSETLDEYVAYLVEEKKGLVNYDLQIVSARSLYVRMDGTTKDINNASIVAGLYSRANVQQSIGETKSFSIAETKMLKLLPLGIEPYVEILDDANYLTFRKYIGLVGYYVTNARMMCADESDYKYAERTRVKNKVLKETRKQGLLQIQSEIDVTNLDVSLKVIAKHIQTPLDQMVTKGEISSANVEIPNGQDILTTEALNLNISYVPKGYLRELTLNIAMRNPLLAQ